MDKVSKANEHRKTCRNIMFLGQICPEKIIKLFPVFKGYLMSKVDSTQGLLPFQAEGMDVLYPLGDQTSVQGLAFSFRPPLPHTHKAVNGSTSEEVLCVPLASWVLARVHCRQTNPSLKLPGLAHLPDLRGGFNLFLFPSWQTLHRTQIKNYKDLEGTFHH